MGFQEFPKVMKHPQHESAEWRQLPGKGQGLFSPDTVMTKAERFPDVTVFTLDQEKQYAARGYRPANMGDAREYELAILESAPTDGYHFQEYPKWKYSKVEVPRLVHGRSEEDSLVGEWFDHPVEAGEEDLEEEEVQVEYQGEQGEQKSAGTGRLGRPKKVHA